MRTSENKKKITVSKQIVIILFLTGVLPVFAAPVPEMLRLEASADAMGSTFSVVLYGEDRNKQEAASEDAFGEVRRQDSMLSNYKPESELSRLNRDAGHSPVAVSEEL